MPKIYPFRPIQYNAGRGDVSSLVAPPYDVLDAKGKARLLAKNGRNIVAVDLPHTPAKELGPAETYQAAGDQFRAWLADGTLERRPRPAIFAYRQTFDFGGKSHQRCGMACSLEVVPFGPRAGGGVLPHEETFSGPKEDRFALMKATAIQLSPIFGLHADERGHATALVRRVMSSRAPDLTARLDEDNVLHEVWTIEDPATIDQYARALEGEDVFIADGHHRYTTGMNYLKMLESHSEIGPDHPARRSMFVLIGMSDPGLVIGPTHRVLGGMSDYTFERFASSAADILDIRPGPASPNHLEQVMRIAAALAPGGESDANVFGLYDFATERCFIAVLRVDDPLLDQFPAKPEAWRRLDVAIIQYALVEGICQPMLNRGQPVKWAFPHSVPDVIEIGKGHETGAGGGKTFRPQLAIVVRPTPLKSVQAVSQANQLMPQKSTFFYPKLATGLFMNPLDE
ncbi:MAG: DUF1015 domain-containing protein [Planctomycetota bacterium]|nr:DUF1015 domain-containing protein [Planctomycetota bacterium]